MSSLRSRLLKAAGITILVPLAILLLNFTLGLVFGGLGLVSDESAVALLTFLTNVVIIAGLLLMRGRRARWFAYGNAPGPLTKRGRGWMLAGLVATFVTAQASALWAMEHLDTSQLENIEESIGQTNPAFLLLNVVVIAPLAEELVFRGYLFARLRHLVPLWPAVLVSSLTFGLIHGNYQQLPLAVIMGIFFAVVAERTRRVWPTVLMHMAFNAVATLLPEAWRNAITSPPVVVVFAIVLVVAIRAILADRGAAGPDGGEAYTVGEDAAPGADGEGVAFGIDEGSAASADGEGVAPGTGAEMAAPSSGGEELR